MKLILPLTVTIPRKKLPDKVFALNLNIYRNSHHMILNKAKELYKEQVLSAISIPGNSGFKSPVLNPPYRFIYTVYPSSNRKFDLANVLPIVQKFTDDALIEFGVIPDDSYKIIPKIDYRFGGVDKENPRVELEIISA